MNIYSDILTIDTSTGKTIATPVTDAWILKNKPQRLKLSLSKSTITADGIDATVLSVQLTSPIMTDGTTTNVKRALTVTVYIGDVIATITLNTSGFGTEQVTALDIGTYSIYAVDLPSNILSLEAV